MQLARQMAGVAAQGFAVAECPDDDIALVDGCHSAGGEFELVVARFVVQNTHRDKHTFLARDIG